MKRERENSETLFQDLDIAKCLMLFSQTMTPQKSFQTFSSINQNSFECKTCNRKFSSFQALGGHRTSHKRPKITVEKSPEDQKKFSKDNTSSSKQIHECSICGERFGLGQALGGHMRRHRAVMGSVAAATAAKVPVLKRSSSCKRVMSLDLNLTPLENDLKFVFGKNMVPQFSPRFIV